MINYNGGLQDTRSQEEKNKDFKHIELFGFGKVSWVEKPISGWKSFPIRNQNGSSMCGAFSGAKVLGANNISEYGFKNLDTRFIYNLRKNKTSEGMAMYDLFDVLCKYGAPEDNTLTSDNLNETQANQYQYVDSVKEEALKYKGSSYVFTSNNIDEIYTAVQNGYFPILLIRCHISEWTSEPKVIDGFTTANFNVSHFIPVVDATLYKGKKCLIIEDSWGSSYGINGRRILSEDFLDQRLIAAGYVIDWKKLPEPKKPSYTFTKPLKKGMNNKDVIALQDILKYEKVMIPTQESTGLYGSITANAVKKLWKKYNIATEQEINSLQGNQIGNKTIKWLNENYGI